VSEPIITEVPVCEMIGGRLWQSGCPVPWSKVRELNINAVVNVGHAEQPWLGAWRERIFAQWCPENVRGHVYLHLPLMDCSGGLDVPACDLAIRSALALMADPERRILVHCEAGAFRSVHVCAGVVASWFRLRGEEAFRYVDRHAGRKNPRESLGLLGWHEHVQTFGRSA
jgi:hypothetical protein